MYTCKICGREFKNKTSYGGHVSSHNRSETYKKGRKKREEKRKIHVCKFCQKTNHIAVMPEKIVHNIINATQYTTFLDPFM